MYFVILLFENSIKTFLIKSFFNHQNIIHLAAVPSTEIVISSDDPADTYIQYNIAT